MTKWKCSALIFALWLGSSPAQAAPELDRSVGVLLASIHELPKKEAFLRLGSERDVREVLFRFAADPLLFPMHRARALEALDYFKDAQVEALYRQVLDAPDTSAALRVRMFVCYARSFPEQAPRVLGPWRLHGDPVLRAAAERALTPR